MRRSYSPYASSMSFGPGPLSPALKALIAVNVAVFLAQYLLPAIGWNLEWFLGLRPRDVVGGFRVWQLATYMFMHVGPIHLLFNMLALWMFGTELERIWGTRFFLKFYMVTGVGAGVLTVLFSLLPFSIAQHVFFATVMGASGAIFGLLLAYAMYFPNRPMYLYFLFPVQTKYAVMIFGALELFSALSGVSGVANATHLGGLLVAYLFLKSGRVHPLAEVKYRYLKWKINRMRARFDVYDGGRADNVDRRVH
jgi:membrane associated rhomboid family serine protease